MRKNDLCMNSTFNRSYGVYFEYMNGEYPSPWFDYSCGWCGEWTRLIIILTSTNTINFIEIVVQILQLVNTLTGSVHIHIQHFVMTIYIYNSLPITLINYTSRTNNNWIKWFIWWTCHVKRWRSSHQIRWWKTKKMNKKSHHHTNDWLLSWKLPLPIKIRTFGKSHSVPYDANNCSLFSMTMRKGFMSILTFISWYCHIKLSFVRSQKYEWMFLLFVQLSPECFATLALPQWVCARKKIWLN